MQKTGNRQQLAKYGEQGHLGGFITSFCAGKTVESFLMDGVWLILVFTDGHQARIGWQDSAGNQLKGEPFLENLDAKVQIVGASVSGIGGNPGG